MTYRKSFRELAWDYLPGMLKFLALILIVINLFDLVSFAVGRSQVEYRFEEDWIRDYNPSFGRKDSPVKLVYFFDFQCPACKSNNVVLQEIYRDYQDKVHFVYRNFVLSEIHPYAEISARAANAVAKQDLNKYLEFKNKLFEYQNELSPDKIRKVAEELNLDMEKWNKDRNSREIALEVEFDLLDIKNGVLPKNERNEEKAMGTPTTIILKENRVTKWFVGQTTKQEVIDALNFALNDQINDQNNTQNP